MNPSQHYSSSTPDKLANFLGWFSLGLGLAEVAAPGWIARRIGMSDDSKSTLRAYGVREIMSGLGVLSPATSNAGVWSRVVGDALDLGAIGSNMNKRDADPSKLGAAAAAVLGVSALDLYCALTQENGGIGQKGQPLQMRETVAINKPAAELYSYWRNLEQLPKLLSFIDSIQVLDEKRSHWKTKPVAGRSVEWQAEITEDVPNQKIAWRSIEGSDVSTSGVVEFHNLPGDRGTAMAVNMQAAPRLGAVGRPVQRFLSNLAEYKIRNDLRRFKQLMETGEIPTTRGQPAGRKEGETKLDISARA